MSVVAVAPSVVAGTAADDTMLIKKSCVLRAKFEIEKEVYISPLGVVPHPMNRGGDPVKVLRCRSITRDIAMYGFDVTEAEQNAVLIESPPDEEAPASSFEPTTRAPPVVTGSRVGASPLNPPPSCSSIGCNYEIIN